MSLKSNIIDKVKSILNTKFEFDEVSYVPDLENSKLTFNNYGLQFEATVLYIDMRGSTKLLNKHTNPVVAKIHMAYFHTIVKLANAYGGEVRSFNGDSMLVFFQGTTKDSLSNAVMVAMKIKYMLNDSDSGINELLVKYTPIDFGIGLDDGKILCTKVGVSGQNNRDLIWIGNPVNKSVVISDKCSSPNHVGISSYVYSNLNDDVKYNETINAYGQKSKVNMWKKGTIKYNGFVEEYYYTGYHWIVS